MDEGRQVGGGGGGGVLAHSLMMRQQTLDVFIREESGRWWTAECQFLRIYINIIGC